MTGTRFIPGAVLALCAACVMADVNVVELRLVEAEPISSLTLEQTLERADFPLDRRVQAEAAFDAYVAGWQHFRDGTIRPFDARTSAIEQARQHLWSMEPGEDMSVAAEALARHVKPMLKERRRMLGHLEAEELRFVNRLEELARDEPQRQAVEALARARQKKRSIAVLDSIGDSSIGRASLEVDHLPMIGLPPELRDRVRARVAAFDNECAEWLVRAAKRGLRDADVDAETAPTTDDPRAPLRMLLQAIEEVAAMLPSDRSESWRRSERDRVLREFNLQPRFWLDAQLLQRALGERASPAAIERVERWQRERRSGEDWAMRQLKAYEWLGPNGDEFGSQLSALDDQLFADLRAMTGIEDLHRSLEPEHSATIESAQRHLFSLEYDEAQVAEIVAKLDETSAFRFIVGWSNEADSPEDDLSMNAARLTELHDELAIPPTLERYWEIALIEFRERREAKRAEGDTDAEPNAEGDPDTEESSADQLDQDERSFFETLQAMMPEDMRESIQLQAARRAFERLGSNFSSDTVLFDPVLKVDPFRAAAELPAEIRAPVTGLLREFLDHRSVEMQNILADTERMEALRQHWYDRFYRHEKAGLGVDPVMMQDCANELTSMQVAIAERTMRAGRDARHEMHVISEVLPEAWREPLLSGMRAQQFPDIELERRCAEEKLRPWIDPDGLSEAQERRIDAAYASFDEQARQLISQMIQIREAQLVAELQRLRRTSDPRGSAEPAISDAESLRQEREAARLVDLSWDLEELGARVARGMRALRESWGLADKALVRRETGPVAAGTSP